MLSISFTLCCVGLVFSSPARGDVGHQRQMREHHIFRAKLQAHLANRFQERQRLDVAHRAADFHEHDVHADCYFAKRGLDFIGHVRNYLHRLAEIIATALFGDDGFVDAAGGPIMVARQMRGSETLVVAEIKIGFSAVVGNETPRRADKATSCQDRRSGTDRTSGG